jgi:hypothetical protein
MRPLILAAALLLSACAASPGPEPSAAVSSIPVGASSAPDAGLDFLSRLTHV